MSLAFGGAGAGVVDDDGGCVGVCGGCGALDAGVDARSSCVDIVSI